jgi:glycosyltransferase involved in cell wall biosynthesis
VDPVASNLADRPENAPVISVIVPAHGRPDKLSQLMDALAKQDLSVDKFELIICDDGSDPPLLETMDLSKAPYGVVVVQQEHAGPAAARNLAMRLARGALLVFLDDDSIPSEACLSGHLAAQLQASGNTAVMGGFTLTEECRSTSLSLLVEQTPMVFPHSALESGRMYSADCLRTANLSIPKALVEAVGGFDETFREPCAEDAELAKRLKRALFTTVLYDPEIKCLHDHAPNIDDFANRQHILGWSTSYMAWRHDDHTLIVGQNASAPGDQFWMDLDTRLQGSIERVEGLLEEIRNQSEKELAGETPSALDPDFLNNIKEIGFSFFSRGLIDGHREIQAMIQQRGSAPE